MMTLSLQLNLNGLRHAKMSLKALHTLAQEGAKTNFAPAQYGANV